MKMDGLGDKFDDLDVVLKIKDLLDQDQSSPDLVLTTKVIFGKIINPKSILRVMHKR